MSMKVIGKADRNWTVGQLMDESARHGAEYLDLSTGDLLDTSSVKPKSEPKDIEANEESKDTVKKKKK